MIIKKIGMLSLAYSIALIYSLIGLFQGIFLVVQLKIPQLASSMDKAILATLGKFGYWLILLCPAFMLLLGFLLGIVIALIYNRVVFRLVGGIKIETA